MTNATAAPLTSRPGAPRVPTGLLAAAPLTAIGVANALPSDGGPRVCPFAILTGIACPLCGLTRGTATLAEGDIAGAAALHPMVFVVVAVALVWWSAALGARLGWWSAPDPGRVTSALARWGIPLFALVWVVRLATGTLPSV